MDHNNNNVKVCGFKRRLPTSSTSNKRQRTTPAVKDMFYATVKDPKTFKAKNIYQLLVVRVPKMAFDNILEFVWGLPKIEATRPSVICVPANSEPIRHIGDDPEYGFNEECWQAECDGDCY